MRFYQTFPDRLQQMVMELSYQQMPSWGNLQQIILQLLFLYMTCRMTLPLIQRLRWARGSVGVSLHSWAQHI